MTGNVPEFWMSKTYLKRVVRIFPRVFYSLNIFIPIRLSLPTSIFGNEKIIEGKNKKKEAWRKLLVNNIIMEDNYFFIFS